MTNEFLISFEGPDGAGKTTVLEKLLPLLQQTYSNKIVSTREPGGVAISECIRHIILDVNHTAMDAKTELLLYIAARRQHLVEKIIPSLNEGAIVIVDRFIDSSVAYQGFGRGLSVEDINWLNAYAIENYRPDLTVYFDVTPEVGLDRIAQNKNREINRLDLEQLEMHQRVRQGYLNLVRSNPDRIVLIDANRPIEQVISSVFQLIKERYKDRKNG